MYHPQLPECPMSQKCAGEWLPMAEGQLPCLPYMVKPRELWAHAYEDVGLRRLPDFSRFDQTQHRHEPVAQGRAGRGRIQRASLFRSGESSSPADHRARVQRRTKTEVRVHLLDVRVPHLLAAVRRVLCRCLDMSAPTSPHRPPSLAWRKHRHHFLDTR